MPRKDNDNNPLQIRMTVDKRTLPRSIWIPRGSVEQKQIGLRRFYERLLRVMDDDTASLPPMWDVTLHWRNPESRGITQVWREDDFESAVRESGADYPGFNVVVRQEIIRQLRRYK